MGMRAWQRRLTGSAMLILATAGILAIFAGPAVAHVEVQADKPQAGASDVTLSFVAEAESSTAGISKLDVVLPDGIPANAVSLVSGPAGWALTPSGTGYTVAGAALPVGTNAEYKVRVTALPAGVTSVAFKTVVTYADGDADRWIEIPTPGQAEPPHPAPVLSLQPAAVTAASSSPASAAPAPATTPVSATPASAAGSAGGQSPLWWIVGVVAVVLAAAVAGVLWSRRRPRPDSTA